MMKGHVKLIQMDMIFEMDNGSVFCYRGSWSHEGLTTSWESEWRIAMTHGMITWDGDHEPKCEIPEEPVPLTESYAVLHPVDIPHIYTGREGHDGCLDEFYAALDEGRDAETCAKDNIYSIMMVFGAVKSAREGRKIYMSEM